MGLFVHTQTHIYFQNESERLMMSRLCYITDLFVREEETNHLKASLDVKGVVFNSKNEHFKDYMNVFLNVQIVSRLLNDKSNVCV